jgi:DNA-binding response OmpR family regulator
VIGYCCAVEYHAEGEPHVTLRAVLPDDGMPPKSPLVLVVEEDAEKLEALQLSLETSGFCVARAATALEAALVTAVTPPDLIIVDIGTPRIAGSGICRFLRRGRFTAHMPIVGVAGAGLAVRRTSDVDCDEVLVEPCPPDALVAAIRRLLPS